LIVDAEGEDADWNGQRSNSLSASERKS